MRGWVGRRADRRCRKTSSRRAETGRPLFGSRRSWLAAGPPFCLRRRRSHAARPRWLRRPAAGTSSGSRPSRPWSRVRRRQTSGPPPNVRRFRSFPLLRAGVPRVSTRSSCTRGSDYDSYYDVFVRLLNYGLKELCRVNEHRERDESTKTANCYWCYRRTLVISCTRVAY